MASVAAAAPALGYSARALTGPAFAPSGIAGSRFWPSPLWRVTSARVADADLVVDLGHGIGSARWWRGVATLSVLVGAAVSLGVHLPAVDGVAPMAPTDAALGEARLNRIEPLAFAATTGVPPVATAMVRRLSETPERPRIELQAQIGSGGLVAALRRSGLGADDLAHVARALSGVSPMGAVFPGSDVQLVLGRRETRAVPRPLEQLAYRAAFDRRVEITRQEDGALVARNIPIAVDNTPIRIRGAVGASFQRAARAAGVPAAVISDYLRQIDTVGDARRHLQGRNRFDMVIAHRRAATGEREFGQLLYAGLDAGKQSVALMRWGKSAQFYTADGEGQYPGGAGAPVTGARVSSPYGQRTHPILGRMRNHNGVDLAVPAGTPIKVTAAGTVAMAGWGGGYGNLVVVNHGNGMQTRYAHMRKFVVKKGDKVQQGQKIGEVGSTGLSTGPHLHYEVLKNGRPVDPQAAKFVNRTRLAKADLARFKAQLAQYQGLAVS